MIHMIMAMIFQAALLPASGEAAILGLQRTQKLSENTHASGTMPSEPHTLPEFMNLNIQDLSPDTDEFPLDLPNISSITGHEHISSASEGEHRSKRQKRSTRHHRHHHSKQSQNTEMGFKRQACPTIKSVEFKKEAEDLFGHKVLVMPVIHIGPITIDQFFHESYCAEEKCNCAGIDKDKYESSCETTHDLTYARIAKNGDIGYSLIKVRTGCQCAIQDRGRSMSLYDDE